MENSKKTHLFPVYEKYGGKIVDYAGWAMPVQFEGLIQEHEAVRNAAGLFDVSHMGEIEVKGKDALKYLQYLLTNDFETMEDNQILYSFMCYPSGGVVDDLLVYKYASDFYLLVVNASNKEKDYKWMLENKGSFDVEIIDKSEEVSEIAIQGPKAERILQKLTDFDLSSISPFYLKQNIKVFGADSMISRTGYTGEDGFEVYLSNDKVQIIWEELMRVGKDEGLKPAGLGARDTLRFEASMPLYGNEISQDITPLEAGLGFFIKLDKEDFIGKEFLLKQKQEGLKRKLVAFEMVEGGIPRHGYEVLKDGEKIGFVTTGYHSPTLKRNIGFALIDSRFTELDTVLEIQIRKKTAKAKIISKKFLKSRNK